MYEIKVTSDFTVCGVVSLPVLQTPIYLLCPRQAWSLSVNGEKEGPLVSPPVSIRTAVLPD